MARVSLEQKITQSQSIPAVVVAWPRKIPFLNGFSKRLKGTSVLLPLGETNGLHPICKGPPTCEMFTGPRAFKTCWTSWLHCLNRAGCGSHDREKICFLLCFFWRYVGSISYPRDFNIMVSILNTYLSIDCWHHKMGPLLGRLRLLVRWPSPVVMDIFEVQRCPEKYHIQSYPTGN